MTDDPQRERTDMLLERLGELPFEEREPFLAGLSEADREAVWQAELDASEDAIPDDYEDLGAGE